MSSDDNMLVRCSPTSKPASVMNVRLPLADWLLHRSVKDGKGRARPLTHFGALQTVLNENTRNRIAQELRATPKV